MGEILLAGISHDLASTMSESWLMDDESERIFAKRVMPRIDDATVLFAEGQFSGIVRPDSPDYDRKLARISPALAASGKRPTLAFADGRCNRPLREKQRIIDDMSLVFRYGSSSVKPPPAFATFRDAVAHLEREDDLELEVVTRPSHRVRAAMNRVRRYNEMCEGPLIRQMRSASGSFRFCIFLAGSAHCVALHVKTGWPLEILREENPARISEVVAAYYHGQALPRLTRQL
jgi:hypothetical protein